MNTQTDLPLFRSDEILLSLPNIRRYGKLVRTVDYKQNYSSEWIFTKWMVNFLCVLLNPKYQSHSDHLWTYVEREKDLHNFERVPLSIPSDSRRLPIIQNLFNMVRAQSEHSWTTTPPSFPSPPLGPHYCRSLLLNPELANNASSIGVK